LTRRIDPEEQFIYWIDPQDWPEATTGRGLGQFRLGGQEKNRPPNSEAAGSTCPRTTTGGTVSPFRIRTSSPVNTKSWITQEAFEANVKAPEAQNKIINLQGNFFRERICKFLSSWWKLNFLRAIELFLPIKKMLNA
jgi:hypothetical protein